MKTYQNKGINDQVDMDKKKKKKNSIVKCCGGGVVKKSLKKVGANLIDRIIDKLPFEAHIPKYQYCGPGTKLEKRLARGDPGINPLDSACKVHDIAYSKHKESSERGKADEMLQKEAVKRIFAKDASLGERAAALGVAAAMKAKRTLSGNGLSNKNIKKNKQQHLQERISFPSLIKNAKLAIKQSKPDTIHAAIRTAISATKQNNDSFCMGFCKNAYTNEGSMEKELQALDPIHFRTELNSH